MPKMSIEWTISIEKTGDATVSCSWDSATKPPACKWTLNYQGEPVPVPLEVAKAMLVANPANVISQP